MTDFKLATVKSVNSAGVTVILDGETTTTSQRFTRLESAAIAAGDRVLLAAVSGSYVVLGKITR